MAIVRHTHRAGTELSPEERDAARKRIAEAAKRPIVFDEDCPELTDEQLAQFYPVNFATWKERAEAIRKAGIADPDETENRKPEEVLVEAFM